MKNNTNFISLIQDGKLNCLPPDIAIKIDNLNYDNVDAQNALKILKEVLSIVCYDSKSLNDTYSYLFDQDDSLQPIDIDFKNCLSAVLSNLSMNSQAGIPMNDVLSFVDDYKVTRGLNYSDVNNEYDVGINTDTYVLSLILNQISSKYSIYLTDGINR